MSGGDWHTLVVHRRKRLAVLRVDAERPVKAVAQGTSHTLNSNGRMWIGGWMAGWMGGWVGGWGGG